MKGVFLVDVLYPLNCLLKVSQSHILTEKAFFFEYFGQILLTILHDEIKPLLIFLSLIHSSYEWTF